MTYVPKPLLNVLGCENGINQTNVGRIIVIVGFQITFFVVKFVRTIMDPVYFVVQ